ADERKRTAFLLGMGWHICPFAYDDLEDDPEQCRFLLQLVMGRFLGSTRHLDKTALREKEALRYMISQPGPIHAQDLAHAFGISRQTARRILLQLRSKEWIQPASEGGAGKRIHAYVVHPQAIQAVL